MWKESGEKLSAQFFWPNFPISANVAVVGRVDVDRDSGGDVLWSSQAASRWAFCDSVCSSTADMICDDNDMHFIDSGGDACSILPSPFASFRICSEWRASAKRAPSRTGHELQSEHSSPPNLENLWRQTKRATRPGSLDKHNLHKLLALTFFIFFIFRAKIKPCRLCKHKSTNVFGVFFIIIRSSWFGQHKRGAAQTNPIRGMITQFHADLRLLNKYSPTLFPQIDHQTCLILTRWCWYLEYLY